jgi:predicted transposase YdaD
MRAMSEANHELQAHDALVKALLGTPEVAARVLRFLLPETVRAAVDFATVASEPGSFVDENLRQLHTDLLFSARLNDGRQALLYLLLEHQSRVEERMAWRLLRYVVRILDGWTREHPSPAPLPAVVPIVLYHGAAPWRAPTDLAELFDLSDELRPALREHLPAFRFVLADLSAYSEQELRGAALGAIDKIFVLSLHHGRQPRDPLAFFASIHSLIREVLRAPGGIAALEQVLRYHLYIHDRVDLRALGEILATQGDEGAREMVMNMAERLIAEGEAKGEEKGMVKGEARLLLKQIRLRFGAPAPEVVARIEAAPLADLDRWGERLLDAATLDDVFRA